MPAAPPRRLSIARILAVSLVLVGLVPFLPLAILTWFAYGAEVAALEREIHATNRQVADLAAAVLDGVVRQVHDKVLLAITGHVHWTSDPLPPPIGGIRWEALRADGVVIASELSPDRVGTPAGYTALAPRMVGGAMPQAFSAVGPWVPGFPPTSVLAQQVGPDRLLAAIVDTGALRDRLASSPASLDRHVYVTDRAGRLLFYSDPQVNERGLELAANPPVKLFTSGGEGEIRFTSIVSGKDRLGFVRPIGEADWGVIVSADIGASVLAVRARYGALGLSIAFAVAAALAILLWSSRRLTAPLVAIRDALRHERRPGREELAAELPTTSIAEYAELAAAVGDLSRRLARTEAELVRAAKASLTGQLASGIAHEIGTPLNVILGNAQYILRRIAEDDPNRATLAGIVRQAERISATVQRFLEFSRTPEAHLRAVDVGEVAAQVLEMVPEIGRGIEARLNHEPRTPPARCDPKLLEHVLMNLVLNACQAMPEGGTLAVDVAAAPRPEDGGGQGSPWVRCRVTDTGHGIAPEHLGRIFEPFFTTKPLGEGTGLGLAIVDRLVSQFGGQVDVESQLGHGSTFIVWLRPAAPAPAGE